MSSHTATIEVLNKRLEHKLTETGNLLLFRVALAAATELSRGAELDFDECIDCIHKLSDNEQVTFSDFAVASALFQQIDEMQRRKIKNIYDPEDRRQAFDDWLNHIGEHRHKLIELLDRVSPIVENLPHSDADHIEQWYQSLREEARETLGKYMKTSESKEALFGILEEVRGRYNSGVVELAHALLDDRCLDPYVNHTALDDLFTRVAMHDIYLRTVGLSLDPIGKSLSMSVRETYEAIVDRLQDHDGLATHPHVEALEAVRENIEEVQDRLITSALSPRTLSGAFNLETLYEARLLGGHTADALRDFVQGKPLAVTTTTGRRAAKILWLAEILNDSGIEEVCDRVNKLIETGRVNSDVEQWVHEVISLGLAKMQDGVFTRNIPPVAGHGLA